MAFLQPMCVLWISLQHIRFSAGHQVKLKLTGYGQFLLVNVLHRLASFCPQNDWNRPITLIAKKYNVATLLVQWSKPKLNAYAFHNKEFRFTVLSNSILGILECKYQAYCEKHGIM